MKLLRCTTRYHQRNARHQEAMLSNARRLDDMDATPADSGNPNLIIITDQLEHLNTNAMAIAQDAANAAGLAPDNAPSRRLNRRFHRLLSRCWHVLHGRSCLVVWNWPVGR